jgi:hypothetical protein
LDLQAQFSFKIVIVTEAVDQGEESKQFGLMSGSQQMRPRGEQPEVEV